MNSKAIIWLLLTLGIALCIFSSFVSVPSLRMQLKFFQSRKNKTEKISSSLPPQPIVNLPGLSKFLRNLPVNSDIDCDYFNDLDTWSKQHKKLITKNQSLWETFDYANCSNLRSQGFIWPVSQEELAHPIAFSIVIYKDVHQFTRLLRAIYRHHNVYCIHVDIGSSPEVFNKVSLLTSCLKNVYLAPERIKVEWGGFSVVQADLVCMRSLWSQKIKWKTWINLTGQEFPLKTNRELVAILGIMNGTNDAGLDFCNYGGYDQWNSTLCLKVSRMGWRERWKKKREPAPHNIRPFKGSVHVVLSRNFVDFLLHNKTSLDFLDWVKKDTLIPDELYFTTMNNNRHLQAPGSNPDPQKFTPSISRLKEWNVFHPVPNCTKIVRSICIMSLRNLKLMASSKQLFVNKLIQDYSPLGYSCLERWHLRKTWAEIAFGTGSLSLDYYRNASRRSDFQLGS